MALCKIVYGCNCVNGFGDSGSGSANSRTCGFGGCGRDRGGGANPER